MILDPGDGLADAARQIELIALPIAWKVLRAAFDRAVLLDLAGAADADERRQPQLFLLRPADQLFQHLHQTIHRVVALELFVGVTPQLRFPYFGLRKILGALEIEIDDAGTNIGATDVDSQDGVMRLEHP